jgi:hypothetical protein
MDIKSEELVIGKIYALKMKKEYATGFSDEEKYIFIGTTYWAGADGIFYGDEGSIKLTLRFRLVSNLNEITINPEAIQELKLWNPYEEQ